ncbi:hypothetical protein HPP92_009188 [Vanilla planifolia]|uniref:SET domain-containing protein n=1 Tax=Vanilla planifolia TaxID=51239 RepID=A0A835RB16_VANPL|nr:hypothetical protein HPP92_009188 [Vanilla planifolia]
MNMLIEQMIFSSLLQRWWDCIALPDDVDSCDEISFRMQIRDLAFASLQLLKEAIFDDECAPLFSLEIYGHIIGMFELNNLDLVVASPVEDYFIYIDDLPLDEKVKLQDKDGQAVIIADRPISPGEEITISYIDEGLPYDERQALLADYGFKCCCPKCKKEQVLR